MNEIGSSWMKLDNAAKIYPAAKRKNWVALFRLSATLTEEIDPIILAKAQEKTLKRFPAFAVHLKTGLFWYYFEHAEGCPQLREDYAYPCAHLSLKDNAGFAFRTLYYKNRIAVEFYHVLTDGTGGMMFLKTLTAEYLSLKYGADIPRDNNILDCEKEPDAEELEDGFIKNAGDFGANRGENDAFKIKGTPESDGFVNLTTAIIPACEIIDKAKSKKTSVTEYLSAFLIKAADNIQRREVRSKRRLKNVKVSVPVNLRNFFPSKTTRNFSSYINPGIDPSMGEYTIDEIIETVHHFLGSEATEKKLRARFTANVHTEQNLFLRITPLFLKNVVMKVAFNRIGDRKNTVTLSNLGVVTLPDEMSKYVTRMEFTVGPLSSNPVVIGALSYNGVLYMNITRTIMQPKFEREFLSLLVKNGIKVKIESNQRY